MKPTSETVTTTVALKIGGKAAPRRVFLALGMMIATAAGSLLLAAAPASASVPPVFPPSPYLCIQMVSLSANYTSVPVGTPVTIKATTRCDVGPTPDYIQIYEDGHLVAVCGYGYTCSITENHSYRGWHDFIAYVAPYNPTPPSSFDAYSKTVSVDWWQIT